MSHTILLVQSGNESETRSYFDYKNVNDCMKGVCKIYEEHLKKQNPGTSTVTYNSGQLFNFIDQFKDLSCFVYQNSTNTYTLYDNAWIKERINTLIHQTPKHTKFMMKK